MSIQSDTALQIGFFERCVRRYGERPWRSFLRLWLILFLVSLPLAFIGWNTMPMSGLPPDPRGIDYAGFLPGGRHATDFRVSVAVKDFPPYDKSLHRNDVAIHPFTDQSTGIVELHARVPHDMSACGWPISCFAWTRVSQWDVTDPTRSFEPARGVFQFDLMWMSHVVGIRLPRAEGAQVDCFDLLLPGLLLQCAAPQLIAASVVMALAVPYGLRRRRRKRRGACLTCGHLLDPNRIDARCPECGLTTSSCSAARRSISGPWRSTCRIFAVFFATMIAVWLVVQIAHCENYPLASMEEKLKMRTESGIAHVGRVTERCAEWGWPAKVFGIQKDHWFAFAPGQAPQRAPRADRATINVAYGDVVSVLRHRDPSVTTLYRVYWTIALFQIALMQVAATMMAFVAGCVLGRRSRAYTGAARPDER